jgi:hypothetical protein
MFGLIPFPVKIGALLFVILGALTFGYMKGSAQAEIALANYRAEAEKQIKELHEENIRISDNVQIQFVDRVNTVKEREIVYQTAAGKLEPVNQVSNGFVELHDATAQRRLPVPNILADNTPSGIYDNSALGVVISNYSTCEQTRQQLISLQSWITQNQEAIEKAKLGNKP